MHFPQHLKIRDRLLADIIWPVGVLECERGGAVEPDLLLALVVRRTVGGAQGAFRRNHNAKSTMADVF